MNITKNYIYNTLLQISNILIPFVTVPYITRVLGSEGIGIVSFSASIANYFVLFGVLGVSSYGNRAIAYVKNSLTNRSKTFWEIFFFKCFTAGISFCVYIVAIFIIKPENIAVYLSQSLLIVAAILDISWLFMGLEDFKKISVRGIVVKLIGLILIFSFVRSQEDFTLYALIISTSNLLGQLILWKCAKKYIIFTPIKIKNIFSHFLGATRLFLPSLAIQVYAVLDKTMIGIFSTNSEVGIYEVSNRLVRMALTLVTSMGTVMLPRISNLFSKDDIEGIKTYARKSFLFTTYSSLLIMSIMIGVIPEFGSFFFGTGFEKTSLLITIMSPIIIFIAWSNVAAIQLMVPMRKEKYFTISVTIGALVNFPINLLIIPRLGSTGAAIGTVIAEFTTMFFLMKFLSKIFDITEFFHDSWKSFISGTGTFLVMRIISNIPVGVEVKILLELITGLFTYITIQFLLKNDMNKLIISKAIKAIFLFKRTI